MFKRFILEILEDIKGTAILFLVSLTCMAGCSLIIYLLLPIIYNEHVIICLSCIAIIIAIVAYINDVSKRVRR